MRNSRRIITLLLCLSYLVTVVSAAGPGPVSPSEPARSAGSEQTVPISVEPEDPAPEETEPAETEPVEPEPEPVDPEPETPELPVSEMTDEQIIEKYSIPNNWARNGLIFAVRNGILAGKGGDNLCPKDSTTHAELAVMLMGILKTDKCESLDRFTDVRAKDWFAEPMGKAVSLGIFPIADPDATALTPKKNITREEAFVAIARVFGIHGSGRQAIYRFSDWKDVSDWAAEDLAAMIEAGYLGGSSGKILPKNQITRQELAVILSNLLTKVDTVLDTDAFTGKLALAAGTVAPGTVITGDLLLSTDAASVHLENVTVTGKLILQGNDSLALKLTDCAVGELVLCRPTVLEANGTVSRITAHARLKLNCSAGAVQVFDSLTLQVGQTVETVTAMYNTSITVNGTVQHMQVLGDRVSINGSGFIDTLHQYGAFLSNWCRSGSVVGAVRSFLEDAAAARLDASVPSYDSPEATISLELRNLPEEWSECDLLWCLDDTVKSRHKRVLVKNGCTVSQNYNFVSYVRSGSADRLPLQVYLITPEESQTLIYSGEVNLDISTALLKKVTASRIDTSVPSCDSPKATISLKLQNMTAGVTEYDLLWCLDGSVQSRYKDVSLKNGSTISQEYYFSDYLNRGVSKLPLRVYLISSNGYQHLVYSGEVKLDPTVAILKKTTAIRTDAIVPDCSAPKATVSLKLQNMTEDWTSCDLLWCLDGSVQSRYKDVSLKNGSTISQEYYFSDYLNRCVTKLPLKVYLIAPNGYQKLIYSGEIKLDPTIAILKKTTAIRVDANVPSFDSPKATISLKLQNMSQDWTNCDLLWCLDGTVKSRYKDVQLRNDSTISQEYNFISYVNGSADRLPLAVYLIAPNGYQKLVYSGEVRLNTAVEAQAKKIRTQNVQGKLKQSTTLYSNMGLSGAIKTYPAGTQLTVLQSRHSSYTKVQMPDGNVGWVSYSKVQIIGGDYYTTTDYTTPMKEYYVNHIRNCTSQTSYLIWVSLYTQRINIFQGSKGNWKLVQSGPIASGRNECPTPVEVTKIKYKTSQWTYSNYYCHHVSVFDEARGFHSRPIAYNGSVYSPAIGRPASAGCVRLMDAECVFIYNNCPIGTAVYIY